MLCVKLEQENDPNFNQLPQAIIVVLQICATETPTITISSMQIFPRGYTPDSHVRGGQSGFGSPKIYWNNSTASVQDSTKFSGVLRMVVTEVASVRQDSLRQDSLKHRLSIMRLVSSPKRAQDLLRHERLRFCLNEARAHERWAKIYWILRDLRNLIFIR